MKILLLGSNGQLGRELERQLSAIGNIEAFPRSEIDITKHQQVHKVVCKIRPKIIVNAAAYTAVDKAETYTKHAYAINAEAVQNLAQIAKQERLWFIHYSTDYVFDGSKQSPYIETDLPNPINVYGMSKLAGERAIADSDCPHLIFRTTWIIGKDGYNFAKTILRLASNHDHLNVIKDQIGVPTSPFLIARVTIDAIRSIMQGQAWPLGIYHLAPEGVSNWYEISKTLIEYAEEQNVLLNVHASNIKAITTADYTTAAKRPLNSLLNTQKLNSQLTFDLPHGQDDFLAVAKDIVKELEKA